MPGTKKEVEIVVLARDEATKTLSGIGDTLKTAIGTFAGGAALNLASAGVEKLFGAISGGVSDARDAALVFAQTQAVIESTGGAAGFTADEIADMAGELSAASGHSLFGDDDIQKGQNMLLTFTNITDKLPDTTQVMLDMAQALGTDAGGAAVQLGKALNDPVAGISALSRVGVSFTEEQKKQIATMVEAGDVSAAQGVILAELNKEFGGSAQAAADADGGFAQFNDRMGELGESLGGMLLPLLNDLLAWLNSPEVQNGINAIADGLASVIGWVRDFGSTLVSSLESSSGFIDTLITIGKEIGTQLLAWGQMFVDWIAPFIPPLLAKALELATSLWGWIKDQAPKLLAQLAVWGQSFIDWVLPMIPPLLAKADQLARDFIAWIGKQAAPILDKLGEWAASLVAWIVPATKDFLAKWPIMFDQFLTWIGEQAGPLLKKLGDWAVSFIAWVIPMIPGFLVAVGGIAAALLIWVAETAVVLLDKIVTEWVPAFIDWIKDSVVPKLGPALQAMLTEIGNWITTTAVPWAAKALKGVGEMIVQSLIDGINAMIEQARQVLNTLIGIVNQIPGLPDIPTVGNVSQKSTGAFTPLPGPGMAAVSGGGGRTTLFENGAITIVQQPGEDAGQLAQRVITLIDRRDRLARTR